MVPPSAAWPGPAARSIQDGGSARFLDGRGVRTVVDVGSRATEHDDVRLLTDGVALANIPVLLMVLVQLTGEMHWLEEPYRVRRLHGLGDNDSGRLPEEIQAEIREAALEAILAWRDGRPVAIPEPSPELLVRMLAWSMGEEVAEEYAPMMAVQNGLTTTLAKPIEGVPPDFRVLVIGAGMHGLGMAVNLQAAGIPFTVVERNEAVGGVWHENHYPGASVDSPNYLYCYTFAPYDWSQYFAMRGELCEYFEHIVDRFELAPSIQLGTAVESAAYDVDAQEWVVEVAALGRVDRHVAGERRRVGGWHLQSVRCPVDPGSRVVRG